MKYMLMLVRSEEDWYALTDEERDYPAIGRWFGELAQKGLMIGGEELQSARTATTVSWNGSQPILTDGPFIEAKEVIAGFYILEARDLDHALEITKRNPATWRGGVEIRPLLG